MVRRRLSVMALRHATPLKASKGFAETPRARLLEASRKGLGGDSDGGGNDTSG